MDSETPPKSSRSGRTQPLPIAASSILARAGEASPNIGEYEYLAAGNPEGTKYPTRRPALPVGLLDATGNRIAQARALVDSGADNTTFSAEWAQLLGISLEDDCVPVRANAAVEGGDKGEYLHYSYTEGLTVEVVGERMLLDVVMFCKGLPVALLGRYDFFKRYFVAIDEPHRRFFLERLREPEEDEDDDDELDAALALS
jgi:hypothetical protein